MNQIRFAVHFYLRYILAAIIRLPDSTGTLEVQLITLLVYALEAVRQVGITLAIVASYLGIRA